MDRRVIDIDCAAGWPDQVRASVDEYAEELRGTTEYTSDLEISYSSEDAFRERLDGWLLQTYHCTRLLDHEVEAIRASGLEVLTEGLLRRRLRGAAVGGAIRQHEYEALLEGNVFAERDHAYRENRVCVVLGQEPFRTDIHGVSPLLSTWGGEAISMSLGGSHWRDRLAQIGTPTIVVTAVDLSRPHNVHPVWPGVLKTFVGSALGLENVYADVHYMESIAGEQVLDVWQPGNPKYDKFDRLPR